MAKKIKIQIDFTEDNNLIGISCHKKDYWIAYQLNASLGISLRRLGDFPFYQSRLEGVLQYSLFHDFSQDDQTAYYLLSNFNPEGPLFPELKTTDFFILVQGRLSDREKSDIQGRIRKIGGVLTAFTPDVGKLREYDNFLSDLEIHMSGIKVKD